MKSGDSLKRQQEVLACLSSLPRKIMTVHELDNVPEFVLHDICNEHCFNMIRAAYFVDNPDFKCLKGVAGFCRDEAYGAIDRMWQDPAAFSQFMQKAAFNQRIRSLLVDHSAINESLPTYVTQHVAPAFGFQRPAWHMWDLKHDNHGLIIYERVQTDEELLDEYLKNGLYVLGFCAIV